MKNNKHDYKLIENVIREHNKIKINAGFVIIEGVDYSGKDTLIKAMIQVSIDCEKNISYKTIKIPYDIKGFENWDAESEKDKVVKLALWTNACVQGYKLAKKYLNEGHSILMGRSLYSTLVYQKNDILDLKKTLIDFHKEVIIWFELPKPDVVFLLKKTSEQLQRNYKKREGKKISSKKLKYLLDLQVDYEKILKEHKNEYGELILWDKE